jgi:hypothetical protein
MKRLVVFLILCLGFVMSCDGPLGYRIDPQMFDDYENLFRHKDKTKDQKDTVTVDISMDSSNVETLRPVYLIGGETSPLLAAIVLRSSGDTAMVDSLVVKVNSSVLPMNMFSTLLLVDSDKTTIIAQSTLVQSETVFKSIGTVGDKPRTIFVKAETNLIGRDQVGVLDAVGDFQIKDVWARSGKKNVQVTHEGNKALLLTKNSSSFQILANKILSVDLVSAGGGHALASRLTQGVNVVGIVKITTTNSFNTDQVGDETKIALNKIRVNLGKNNELKIDSLRIVRVGLGESMTIPYSDNAEFDISGFGNDGKIAGGSSAYFVVTAKVLSLLGSGGDQITIGLHNLNKDTDVSNFVWRDTEDSVWKGSLRLPFNKIDGIKITS